MKLKLVGGSVYHKLNTMTPCFSKGEHEYFWSSPDGSKLDLKFSRFVLLSYSMGIFMLVFIRCRDLAVIVSFISMKPV